MFPDSGLCEVLDAAACQSYLEHADVGRVAFTAHALPTIWPFAFVTDGGDVVLRVNPVLTDPGLLERSIVAFEVDGIDDGGIGYAVQVLGRTSIDHGDFASRFRHRWQGQDAPIYMRITGDRVSGRRIVPSAYPALSAKSPSSS